MKIVQSLRKRKLSIQNFFLKFTLLSNTNYVRYYNKRIHSNWEEHQRKVNIILSDIKVSSADFSQVSFTLNRNIPQLAWCLKISESSINVNYGSGVNCHSMGIVEGVWDGDFNSFDYLKSEHIFGSGLTIDNNKIIITPPSHMYECIFLIKNKVTKDLIISNSLAYCLSFFKNDIKNEDEIFEDIRKNNDAQTRLGVLGFEPLIYEHESFNLYSLYYHNFSVSSTEVKLEARLYERNYINFESYKNFLEDKLTSLIKNGESQTRLKQMKAFSTLSKGYDSPAVTCLLKEVSDFECATINVEVHGLNDSGLEIGEKLGINCISCEHPVGSNIQNLGDIEYSTDLAERSKDFFATQGLGDNSVFLGFDSYLDDKLLFTGSLGDSIWGSKTVPLSGIPSKTLYGKSMTEYRLKKGFVQIPVPAIGAVFPVSIYRLNFLSDMKPYSIKGNYNRPIARRIIESAGIPRGIFAIEKNATNPHITNTKKLKKDAFYKVFNDYNFE